jgi:uncharacterized membrane protein (TIGR02234 family)
VLLGLAASGGASLAGHKGMLALPEDFLASAGLLSLQGRDGTIVEFPLAGALGLVALACWGVLLVTRGVVRRVVAALAALAALGVLAVVVIGGFLQVDDAAADLSTRLGASSFSDLPLERTGWFWVALVAALAGALAGGAAVRFVGGWPEMGTRYDAPTGGAGPAPGGGAGPSKEPEEQSNLDLWKSLDEGTDPTEK